MDNGTISHLFRHQEKTCAGRRCTSPGEIAWENRGRGIRHATLPLLESRSQPRA